MFERYTEPARRSLFFARYESSVLGSMSIELEHLLLGILREGHTLADLIPSQTADAIRREVLQHTSARTPVPTSIEIPFSKATKRALEAAASEADSLRHGYIGPEHLLLALGMSDDGIARILAAHGLDPVALRDQIRRRPPQLTGTEWPPRLPDAPLSSPEGRRNAIVRQLDAVVSFVTLVGEEYAGRPDAGRLVEQICRDLLALKAAISQE